MESGPLKSIHTLQRLVDTAEEAYIEHADLDKDTLLEQVISSALNNNMQTLESSVQ